MDVARLVCFFSVNKYPVLSTNHFDFFLFDETRYDVFVGLHFVSLMYYFLSFRMTQTSEGAGRTPDARTRHMPTPAFHLLMPRLQQHSAREG